MTGIIINNINGINGINSINGITIFVCRAIMKGGENVNYIEIYKRVSDYHRKYSGMKGSDEEWDECVHDGESIAKSFNNGRFVSDMIIAVQNEISRKLKEAGK